MLLSLRMGQRGQGRRTRCWERRMTQESWGRVYLSCLARLRSILINGTTNSKFPTLRYTMRSSKICFLASKRLWSCAKMQSKGYRLQGSSK